MAGDREALREWHRLFGLLLTDYFTDTPFVVEVERDLSKQKQLLDVVIVRRGRGRIAFRLPDGLGDLAAHNLITFKSHREALDAWAVKELVGHYVAYRKLVSPSPGDLMPEDGFRLYAVCARFPHNLSSQAPWRKQGEGVYDCQWGADVVRVVVAGELPREPQNAPLHLFSASAALMGFGRGAYRQRSGNTSRLLGQLLERSKTEGLLMYTMEDFNRDYVKKGFLKLTPQERQEVLKSMPLEEQQEVLRTLPPERRLAGLSEEQIRKYLDQLSSGRPTEPRKQRRKK